MITKAWLSRNLLVKGYICARNLCQGVNKIQNLTWGIGDALGIALGTKLQWNFLKRIELRAIRLNLFYWHLSLANIVDMSFPVDEMIDLTRSADLLVISPVASSMNVQKPTKIPPCLVAIQSRRLLSLLSSSNPFLNRMPEANACVSLGFDSLSNRKICSHESGVWILGVHKTEYNG